MDENLKEKINTYQRVRKTLWERRKRVIDGSVNSIPWGLPRFEKENPGLEQGKYYLLTGNQKSGKTQITRWLFVYNILDKIFEKKINIKIKIFYFTLEMTKEENFLSLMSNVLYMKEGIRISPSDLKSTSSKKILDEKILHILDKYKEYFSFFEKSVEFIDSITNPTWIYKTVRSYVDANGIQHKREIKINDKTSIEVDDYYEPYDKNEYVLIVIDHIGLISTESENGKQLSLHQSISKLSKYLVKIRNKYNYIPIVIQQQAASQESILNAKANKLKPTVDGLGENKLTARDANVIMGIFSPFRHELKEYPRGGGYDITKFKDSIRFLEIIANREGSSGVICPLYFDGAVNFFKELPLPEENLENIYKHIKKK